MMTALHSPFVHGLQHRRTLSAPRLSTATSADIACSSSTSASTPLPSTPAAPVVSASHVASSSEGDASPPRGAMHTKVENLLQQLADVGKQQNVVWFYCNEKGCTYKAKHKGTLKRHQAGAHHKGVVWHYCPESGCTHRAKRKDNLKTHMVAVHGKAETPSAGVSSSYVSAVDLQGRQRSDSACSSTGTGFNMINHQSTHSINTTGIQSNQEGGVTAQTAAPLTMWPVTRPQQPATMAPPPQAQQWTGPRSPVVPTSPSIPGVGMMYGPPRPQHQHQPQGSLPATASHYAGVQMANEYRNPLPQPQQGPVYIPYHHLQHPRATQAAVIHHHQQQHGIILSHAQPQQQQQQQQPIVYTRHQQQQHVYQPSHRPYQQQQSSSLVNSPRTPVGIHFAAVPQGTESVMERRRTHSGQSPSYSVEVAENPVSDHMNTTMNSINDGNATVSRLPIAEFSGPTYQPHVAEPRQQQSPVVWHSSPGESKAWPRTMPVPVHPNVLHPTQESSIKLNLPPKPERDVKVLKTATVAKRVFWHHCEEPGCGYKAKQKGDLKRHNAAVHNKDVVWYHCTMDSSCLYKAKRKGSIKRHIAAVHRCIV